MFVEENVLFVHRLQQIQRSVVVAQRLDPQPEYQANFKEKVRPYSFISSFFFVFKYQREIIVEIQYPIVSLCILGQASTEPIYSQERIELSAGIFSTTENGDSAGVTILGSLSFYLRSLNLSSLGNILILAPKS